MRVAEKLTFLGDPTIQETLDLLGDPLVAEGLRLLKDWAYKQPDPIPPGQNVPNPDGVVPCSRQYASNTTGVVASSVQQPIQQTGFSTSRPVTPIHVKQEPTSDSNKLIGIDDFDNMFSSPRGGRGGQKRPADSKVTGTPKKSKPNVSDENKTSDDYIAMAEVKRKAIHECNTILTVNRPKNDPDRVIFHTAKDINRSLVFGPSKPHTFFKIIGNMIPELEDLTDEEKVPQLMRLMSRFVGTNLLWAEVTLSRYKHLEINIKRTAFKMNLSLSVRLN